METDEVKTDDVQQAIEAELALLTTEVRRSRNRLEQLLDPEFREAGASGRRWTRPEIVAALMAGGDMDDDESVMATDVEGVVVAPGVVLVTYLTEHGDRRTRRSSLWRRSTDGWRVLYHQGTPCPH